MINSLIFYFFLFPISEYFIHLILHKTNNYIHKKHHIKYHTNNFSFEKTPLVLASLSYYFYYTHTANCFIIYWIIHSLIHTKPTLLHKLFKHHHLHHKYNNCNYSVCAIWPDYLFNTIKTS